MDPFASLWIKRTGAQCCPQRGRWQHNDRHVTTDLRRNSPAQVMGQPGRLAPGPEHQIAAGDIGPQILPTQPRTQPV